MLNDFYSLVNIQNILTDHFLENKLNYSVHLNRKNVYVIENHVQVRILSIEPYTDIIRCRTGCDACHGPATIKFNELNLLSYVTDIVKHFNKWYQTEINSDILTGAIKECVYDISNTLRVMDDDGVYIIVADDDCDQEQTPKWVANINTHAGKIFHHGGIVTFHEKDMIENIVSTMGSIVAVNR